MAYTPDKPKLPESSEELRARIPGWGVDLDPLDRPSVPREVFDPTFGGAHWEFPERQPERVPRERSIEHEFLTPVFGTSCPPRGLSGVIRRYSYAKYSEGRAAHWLLLLAADRVDAVESVLRSLATARPDNPVTETGVLSELSHHGLRSRLGRNRADVAHHPLDPVIVAAPWVVGAWLGYAAARRIARRVTR
ncbi:hypothetical protein QLQ12_13130 [Actinoplanes sp. NEAU-A12]|uniref:Uncharacterized protein n=1 Tax=Actinoplanes sandaracinus TaxID=3045177 RepID=A0ABT6WII5_9ACTN|nr:hypothetical protein [Actinoplanes sandaracinus]MDI6099540.1 hypothetical protein [Actinoplanes sandaracinus]